MYIGDISKPLLMENKVSAMSNIKNISKRLEIGL